MNWVLEFHSNPWTVLQCIIYTIPLFKHSYYLLLRRNKHFTDTHTHFMPKEMYRQFIQLLWFLDYGISFNTYLNLKFLRKRTLIACSIFATMSASYSQTYSAPNPTESQVIFQILGEKAAHTGIWKTHILSS